MSADTLPIGNASAAPSDRLEALLARLADAVERLSRPVTTEPLAVGITEAARLIDISSKSLKRLIAENAVPGVVKIRRRVVISVVALREWLATGATELAAASTGRRARRAR
jgi:hypothetical protein